MTESRKVSEATRLLRSVRGESPGSQAAALEELFPIVYDELRDLAAACFRRERVSHTLQPTALVHEAFLRVVDQSAVNLEDRSHFFGLASRVMRQVLVDHARRQNAVKRKKDRVQMTLDRVVHPSEGSDIDVEALHDALQKLAEMDERKSRVVELRFFGGLTVEEAAVVLGVSKRSVEADWFLARAWLRGELAKP